MHRDDLLGQPAVLGRRGRLLVAGRGERVLALTGDLGLLVVVLGGEPHGDVVERVGQAVVHHRVDQGAIAEAVAGPGPRQQVRRLGHRLHAAGHHDVGVPGPDHLVRQVDRVEAGEAHLVDGVGRHAQGDPAFDRGLPGCDLALPGLEDLAHEHVVHLVRGQSGPRQRLGDGESPQVHGGEAGQRPGQLADGGPSSSDDDGFSHDHNLRVSAG